MIPSMAIWYSGQESNITLSRAHYQDYCCNLYVGRIQNITPSLQQAQYIDAGLVVASSSLCVLSITGQDWLCRHMQGCLATVSGSGAWSMVRRLGPFMLRQTKGQALRCAHAQYHLSPNLKYSSLSVHLQEFSFL